MISAYYLLYVQEVLIQLITYSNLLYRMVQVFLDMQYNVGAPLSSEVCFFMNRSFFTKLAKTFRQYLFNTYN